MFIKYEYQIYTFFPLIFEKVFLGNLSKNSSPDERSIVSTGTR